MISMAKGIDSWVYAPGETFVKMRREGRAWAEDSSSSSRRAAQRYESGLVSILQNDGGWCAEERWKRGECSAMVSGFIGPRINFRCGLAIEVAWQGKIMMMMMNAGST